MKTKISKRKFYNKFDYKISLKIKGCGSLRYHTISDSKIWLENNTLPKFYISEITQLSIIENRNILINLCEILLKYDKNQWHKRIEGDCIDIYTSEKDIVDDLCANLSDNIICVFEPCQEPALPGTIRVKKLPGEIYNYRVYLLPHKLRDLREEKEKFISWIKSQQTKIKISNSVENWFINTNWNWDPRYILVDEESTLLMLKLRNPEIIGRIYKFVTN